jgi:hypothetical protein
MDGDGYRGKDTRPHTRLLRKADSFLFPLGRHNVWLVTAIVEKKNPPKYIYSSRSGHSYSYRGFGTCTNYKIITKRKPLYRRRFGYIEMLDLAVLRKEKQTMLCRYGRTGIYHMQDVMKIINEGITNRSVLFLYLNWNTGCTMCT